MKKLLIILLTFLIAHTSFGQTIPIHIKVRNSGGGSDSTNFYAEGPIKVRDTTKGAIISLDNLNMPELRYALANRNIHTDSTLTDKKYVDSSIAAVGGGGLSASNLVFNETPSGAVDGTNATFTLANTPTLGKVTIYLNGLLQATGSGSDYTISVATITFITPPTVGDIITANYLK